MMISQGSSEHSICFAVPENAAEHVRRVVERAFAAELRARPGPARRRDDRLRDPRRRRRRHGRHAGRRRQVLRRARRGRRQRARDRAGRVGAQHLRGHRREGQRARAARGARQLLPLRENDLDRRDRPGPRRRRAARPDRARGARPTRAVQPRPARARDREQQANAARDAAHRPRSLARHAGRRQGARAREARRARADRLPAALGADRLHGEPRGRRPLRRLARTRHPRDHAEQARAQRPDRVLPRAQAREPRGTYAFPVRGDGRCGAAGDPDAAGPRGDRRRDPQHRGHLLGHARVPVQSSSTASARSPRSCARRRLAATPSRIRATICRAWTSRARP